MNEWMNEWMNEGQIHRQILKLTTGLLSAITKCGENFQQITPFNYNIVINTCTLRIKRTKSACNDWSNTKNGYFEKRFYICWQTANQELPRYDRFVKRKVTCLSKSKQLVEMS